MQNAEELLAIFDTFKNSNNNEAREIYSILKQNNLTFESIELILNYFDKMKDYNSKIAFLEYLIGYYSNPELLCILGHTYKKVKDYNKAKYYYDKAIELDPSNFIFHYNKGIVLYEQELYEESLSCFIESSLCNKNVDLIFYNLGNTYLKLEDFYNAVKSYKMAIELNDKFSEAYYNLGVTYEKIKLPEEALKCYEQASIIEPLNASYGWNKSLMLLYLKKYKEGFNQYENRLLKKNYKYKLSGKRYKGENLEGKTLLVYAEQGFGDALLFIRLIPFIKLDRTKIILFTHKKLIKLFKYNNFADEYYDLNNIFELNINYDYYVSLLSLPAVLNKSLILSSNSMGYLKRDDNLTNDIIIENSKFKIGVVWKGNPEPKVNRVRHTELKYFEKISQINNVQLFSFQLDGTEEIKKCGFDITDLSHLITDFYDTAQYLQKMDLLITVDTAILHLSGSLGVNTIALLPNNLDWRWNDNNGISSLYNSVKLIKQDIDNNWDKVFDELYFEVIKIIEYADGNLSKPDTDFSESDTIQLFKEGKYEDVINIYSKNLLQNPFDKRVLSNRGLALQHAGRYDEAILDFKKAIELDEFYLQARLNLVSLLLDLEDFGECEKELTFMIEKNGYNKDTLFVNALFFHKTKKYDEAEKIYLKLRDNYEDELVISMNLGMLYNEIGHYVKAANIFIEESQKYPNTPELYFHLGNVYANYQEFERAINWYLKAIQLNNKYLDAYLNLGNAYFNLRKLDDALVLYKNLLSFGFKDFRIYQSIGIIYYELKDYISAENNFIKALEIENKSSELFLGYAENLLMLGKFKIGWDYYHKRIYKDINLYPYINKIPNKISFNKNDKVLVVGEQGIGDNIMFGRYLIPLSKVIEITLLIRKDLYHFFCDALSGHSIKVSVAENIVNYDYVIPLLDLPRLFETDAFNIPSLNYSFNRIKPIQVKKKNEDNLSKIGICWKGKRTPYHNRKRHISLKKMLHLFNSIEANRLTVINLQHEITDKEKELLESFNIEAGVEGNEDIIDTINIISNLDIVITVDTSIAHIAGTLNKLTYLLLCFSPDWRWGYDGNITAWYPSVKIFRQTELDNWDNVLNEVNMELKKYLKLGND